MNRVCTTVLQTRSGVPSIRPQDISQSALDPSLAGTVLHCTINTSIQFKQYSRSPGCLQTLVLCLTWPMMRWYCTVLYPVTYGTVLYSTVSTQFLMTYSVVPDTRSCGRLYVKSRCGRKIIFSWTLATNDWRLVIFLCRNDNKRPSEQKPIDI